MGLFNKYGLEVEPIFLRGGQMATQALVAGDPPIVNIGTVVQAKVGNLFQNVYADVQERVPGAPRSLSLTLYRTF